MTRSRKPRGASGDSGSGPESPLAASFAANRKKAAAMAKVTAAMGGWRPAPEVLREVEAVPTRFLQYDVATGVGGHPISRITLLHGPSGNGKSEFALGLGESFLRREHFFGLLDAERTTPASWTRALMHEAASLPTFVALPVSTYEKSVDGVRRFCTAIADARAAGTIDRDTTGLVVVDSVRALVPADMMKHALAELKGDGSEKKPRGRFGKAKKGIDGTGGRSGQIKAHLNSIWVDELVPLLADTRTGIVMIGREVKDEDAGFFDSGVKVGGGAGLVFGASLRLRVTSKFLYEGEEGNRRCVGEVHQIAIHKTKVSGKLEPVVFANYHTSNGVDAPAGFWPERDALEIAEECGVITLKGSWHWFDGKRIGNGRLGVLKRLHDEPALLVAIDAAVREMTRKVPVP